MALQYDHQKKDQKERRSTVYTHIIIHNSNDFEKFISCKNSV